MIGQDTMVFIDENAFVVENADCKMANISIGQCKKKRNPIANALELRFSCTNPSLLSWS